MSRLIWATPYCHMMFFDVLHRHLGQVGPENRDVEVVAQNLERLHGGDAACAEGDEEVRRGQAVRAAGSPR